MYSSEDLEIKCKSNTMKLASVVEMQPLLSKDLLQYKTEALPHGESIQHFCVCGREKLTYTFLYRNDNRIILWTHISRTEIVW